jgi:hypothetical protein
MKRIALIAVLMVMIMSLFVACLHDSAEEAAEDFFGDLLPDLAGTWAGPGHYFEPPEFAEEIFVDIELTLESDGDISSATLNGQAFSTVLSVPEDVTGTVSSFDAQGLVEFLFSNGFTGGVIFDPGDLKYLYFFTHANDSLGSAFADGTLEQGGTTFSGTPSNLVGTYTGIGFEFDDSGGSAEWFEVTDFVATMPDTTVDIEGTYPDLGPFTGTLDPHAGFDTNGNFEGSINITGDGSSGIFFGFMSPDKQVIGFLTWGAVSGKWSAVLLKKTPG